MIVGDICFKNSVEMLSNPQDALFGRLSIILETYCSSTLFNANLQFMLSQRLKHHSYLAQQILGGLGRWLMHRGI